MFVTSDLTDLARLPRAVALGTFDGVHVGHRRLLARTHLPGLVPTVVTFDPHPRLVLGRAVRLICSLERRLELMAHAGIRDVLVVPFTTETARIPGLEWIDTVLRPLEAERVVVGENYRFGHRAACDASTLRDCGLNVDEVPLARGASSTRIRELVSNGDVAGAASLLGRSIEVEGEPGDGATLRLPRAGHTLFPPSGTYVGRALGRPATVTLDVTRGSMGLGAIGSDVPGGVPVRVELRSRCATTTRGTHP